MIHQGDVDLLGSEQNIFAIIIAGISDFAVNSILVSLIIGFAGNMQLRYVWSQNFSRVIWFDLSMIPLGTFLAILWRFNPISISFIILPLFVVRHSYQTANHLQRQTEDALRALVSVIDERDNETRGHSERVSKLAKDIGKELGMPSAELDVLVPAALLHDLGKVGMEGNLLFKPERLTEDERNRSQRHAVIGGELLSKFPLFERGADLVRHHHERYDGTGYPDGLKGEDIPLGARVISVADSFIAMTEDRPYRKGVSQDEAIAELLRCSGTQFDPRVVQALIRFLRRDSPVVISQVIKMSQESTVPA
jgi:putative nucleotidyltransferase with HDIG domain